MKHDALAADVPLIMRGWVHRQDVLSVLARATALVFPSLWAEPLSRVLLEALALGTPIAAMVTGGTAEIVTDGDNGLLAEDAHGWPRPLRAWPMTGTSGNASRGRASASPGILS